MQIYNTLTRRKEEFVPIVPGKVSMYACGTTPYKSPHIGHAMQAVFFDVMRRYLEFSGYEVKYVRNYTDIDDKIINEAKALGVNALEHSENIIRESDEVFDVLSIKRAHVEPKVSDHIKGIIKMSEDLIEKGFAYATKEGNVYFKVRQFKGYGKLSGQKIDELRVGVRKDNEPDKEDVVDFALWKAAKEGEIFWDSPWGKGRPGWHIECSVMSSEHLSDHFDIHGGGADLVFPHHENEIAQSEAAHDGHFANYWVHNGLLMVGKEKMSKSLKNDTSIKGWLQRYHPDIVRYLIVSNHYRSHVQFDQTRYDEAERVVYRMYKTVLKKAGTNGGGDANEKTLCEFKEAMDNDFNTAEAVALLHKILPEVSVDDSQYRAFLVIADVLGIFQDDAIHALNLIENQYLEAHGWTREKVLEKIAQMEEARSLKNYGKSDELRIELEGIGLKVLVTKEGILWEL